MRSLLSYPEQLLGRATGRCGHSALVPDQKETGEQVAYGMWI